MEIKTNIIGSELFYYVADKTVEEIESHLSRYSFTLKKKLQEAEEEFDKLDEDARAKGKVFDEVEDLARDDDWYAEHRNEYDAAYDTYKEAWQKKDAMEEYIEYLENLIDRLDI